jgi:apolipoprotein N-acyltransferase
MLNQSKYILALTSGALLYLGWPPLPLVFLLFIGLVPLLIIHNQIKFEKNAHVKLLGWAYFSMLIFNTASTWWVWNASPSGCIMMLVLNSLIMALPFFLFSITHLNLPKTGYSSLVFYYIAMEYIHFNWPASWPWLTLGKGLAGYPALIQWYEYTGEMGGTLLILVMNVWIAKLVVKERKKVAYLKPILTLLVISIVSLGLGSLAQVQLSCYKKNIACVVSQPNIDPYTEKFEDGEKYITPEQQLKYGIDVALPLIDSTTQLLVFPETSITGWNHEDRLNEMSLLQPLRTLTDSTGLTILSGAETLNVYDGQQRPNVTARYDSFSGTWWDSYNTALLFQNNKVDSIYHKSKLVPGVEKMPFEFLEKLSINLGGTSGSLGVSDRPINFIVNKDLKIAPLICYESIFGDYACEFVRDGANALAVITNDGWWGNSPGYRQHLLFGSIRCIETRKDMVRSANTGISAKINAMGEISNATQYRERTAFKCSIAPNEIQTFYVQHGNLVGSLGVILAALFLLMTLFVKWFFRIKN